MQASLGVHQPDDGENSNELPRKKMQSEVENFPTAFFLISKIISIV